MELTFYTVDAFTQEPFSGNPAAVIIEGLEGTSTPSDDIRLQIAAEFNLSETAYATRLSAKGSEEPRYSLTWFTPTEEIPLCGHATLATAQIIFKHHESNARTIHFESRRRGTLVARKNDDDSISLDFPVSSLVTLSLDDKRWSKALDKILKITKEPDDVMDMGHVVRMDWADEVNGLVVELSDEVDLEHLKVDPSKLSGIAGMVILTQPAPKGSGHDIYSRVFAPDIGVPEDPVTGAAHTALAAFYTLESPSLSRLYNSAQIRIDRTLRAKQVGRRGGELIVKYDPETKRVELRGFARQVMQGQISL
ncbi:Yhi9p [Sporobolomyces koalae]|uniref:Yhi9p n=1 Tax=Sporobolomyces koalae TaxID=500713 RepID=UPI00316B81DF